MELANKVELANKETFFDLKSAMKKETIIKIPLDTLYFQELVNLFLQNYNTVSIQITKDCYYFAHNKKLKHQELQNLIIKVLDGTAQVFLQPLLHHILVLDSFAYKLPHVLHQ